MSLLDGNHGITDSNILVWNQGRNPLVNFNFMLRVELLFDLPCKSVKAFTREMEYDFIQEGGLNDYVHMLRKPISRPFTLEVERYVGVDYVDPMPLGGNLALPVFLFVGRAPNQFIPGLVARTYVFTGCCVMKKTYGELSGDQSGLLVETTTLGYREMLCVDIPWSEILTDLGADYATPATNSINEEARKKDKLVQLKKEANELEAKAQENAAAASQDKTAADSLLSEVNTLLEQLAQMSDTADQEAALLIELTAKSDKQKLELLQSLLEARSKDQEDNQATYLSTVESKNQEIQATSELTAAEKAYSPMKEAAQKISSLKTDMANIATELQSLRDQLDERVNPEKEDTEEAAPADQSEPAGQSEPSGQTEAVDEQAQRAEEAARAAQAAREERQAKAEAAQREREAEQARQAQDAADAAAAREERQAKARAAQQEREAEQARQAQDAVDAEAAREERRAKAQPSGGEEEPAESPVQEEPAEAPIQEEPEVPAQEESVEEPTSEGETGESPAGEDTENL